MKLIIGLGNPGAKYEKSRHNVGHMVIDALESKFKSKFKNFIVKKTNVLMNNSGRAVKGLITNYKLPIASLYIVHDDLDIPLGQFKIQFGKGPKDHRGMQSVEKVLGINDFWRVRVGIENRAKSRGQRVSGEEYVLQEFLPEEKTVIEETISKAVRELLKRL